MDATADSKPIVRSRAAYQDPLETWSAKFLRKFNENPWVPIGCLLTCGALVMSAQKLRQGKSKEMNRWLRARVAFQGVTIIALVVGSMQLQKARESERTHIEAVAAEQAAREKLEFEKRLKEAERTTLEEAKLTQAARKEVTKESSSWWWSRREQALDARKDDKT